MQPQYTPTVNPPTLSYVPDNTTSAIHPTTTIMQTSPISRQPMQMENSTTTQMMHGSTTPSTYSRSASTATSPQQSACQSAASSPLMTTVESRRMRKMVTGEQKKLPTQRHVSIPTVGPPSPDGTQINTLAYSNDTQPVGPAIPPMPLLYRMREAGCFQPPPNPIMETTPEGVKHTPRTYAATPTYTPTSLLANDRITAWSDRIFRESWALFQLFVYERMEVPRVAGEDPNIVGTTTEYYITREEFMQKSGTILTGGHDYILTPGEVSILWKMIVLPNLKETILTFTTFVRVYCWMGDVRQQKSRPSPSPSSALNLTGDGSDDDTLGGGANDSSPSPVPGMSTPTSSNSNSANSTSASDQSPPSATFPTKAPHLIGLRPILAFLAEHFVWLRDYCVQSDLSLFVTRRESEDDLVRFTGSTSKGSFLRLRFCEGRYDRFVQDQIEREASVETTASDSSDSEVQRVGKKKKIKWRELFTRRQPVHRQLIASMRRVLPNGEYAIGQFVHHTLLVVDNRVMPPSEPGQLPPDRRVLLLSLNGHAVHPDFLHLQQEADLIRVLRDRAVEDDLVERYNELHLRTRGIQEARSQARVRENNPMLAMRRQAQQYYRYHGSAFDALIPQLQFNSTVTQRAPPKTPSNPQPKQRPPLTPQQRAMQERLMQEHQMRQLQSQRTPFIHTQMVHLPSDHRLIPGESSRSIMNRTNLPFGSMPPLVVPQPINSFAGSMGGPPSAPVATTYPQSPFPPFIQQQSQPLSAPIVHPYHQHQQSMFAPQNAQPNVIHPLTQQNMQQQTFQQTQMQQHQQHQLPPQQHSTFPPPPMHPQYAQVDSYDVNRFGLSSVTNSIAFNYTHSQSGYQQQQPLPANMYANSSALPNIPPIPNQQFQTQGNAPSQQNWSYNATHQHQQVTSGTTTPYGSYLGEQPAQPIVGSDPYGFLSSVVHPLPSTPWPSDAAQRSRELALVEGEQRRRLAFLQQQQQQIEHDQRMIQASMAMAAAQLAQNQSPTQTQANMQRSHSTSILPHAAMPMTNAIPARSVHPAKSLASVKSKAKLTPISSKGILRTTTSETTPMEGQSSNVGIDLVKKRKGAPKSTASTTVKSPTNQRPTSERQLVPIDTHARRTMPVPTPVSLPSTNPIPPAAAASSSAMSVPFADPSTGADDPNVARDFALAEQVMEQDRHQGHQLLQNVLAKQQEQQTQQEKHRPVAPDSSISANRGPHLSVGPTDVPVDTPGSGDGRQAKRQHLRPDEQDFTPNTYAVLEAGGPAAIYGQGNHGSGTMGSPTAPEVGSDYRFSGHNLMLRRSTSATSAPVILNDHALPTDTSVLRVPDATLSPPSSNRPSDDLNPDLSPSGMNAPIMTVSGQRYLSGRSDDAPFIAGVGLDDAILMDTGRSGIFDVSIGAVSSTSPRAVGANRRMAVDDENDMNWDTFMTEETQTNRSRVNINDQPPSR